MEFNNEHSLKMNLFNNFENGCLDISMPSTENTDSVNKELKEINRIKSKHTENESESNGVVLPENKYDKQMSEEYLNLISKLPLMINKIVEELVKNSKITKKTKQEQIENRVFTELGSKLRADGISTELSPETLAGIKTLIDIKVKAELDLLRK